MAITREQTQTTELKIGFFHKILLALSVLAIVTIMGVNWYTAPKTFTIDSKHWDCTDTQPNGIEAECTNFSKKKLSLRTQ